MEMASIVELMTLGNCQLAAVKAQNRPWALAWGPSHIALVDCRLWMPGQCGSDWGSANLKRQEPSCSRAVVLLWTQDKAAFALPPGTIRKMLAEWLMRGLATVLETLQGNASSSEVLTGQNGLALRGMRS